MALNWHLNWTNQQNVSRTDNTYAILAAWLIVNN